MPHTRRDMHRLCGAHVDTTRHRVRVRSSSTSPGRNDRYRATRITDGVVCDTAVETHAPTGSFGSGDYATRLPRDWPEVTCLAGSTLLLSGRVGSISRASRREVARAARRSGNEPRAGSNR